MVIGAETIARLRGANSLEEVLRLGADEIRVRGVPRASYHHHAPPGAPDWATTISVYAFGFPEDWVEVYRANNYGRIDPIARRAARECFPFWWADVIERGDFSAAERAYVERARAAHLGSGLAVPVFGPNGRNGYVGIGFGKDPPVISDLDVLQLQWLAELLHKRYSEILIGTFEELRLSTREMEVLQWIAQGKSNSVVADIVGISEGTVDTYLKRAFTKLGVHDRITAVLRALALGLMN